MKRHTAVIKFLAAFILLLALTSMLLPFCVITTASESKSVSGMKVLKISADAGYEYYSQGSIENDYLLVDQLTWGELKDSVQLMSQNDIFKIVICLLFVVLPILFCFIAMLAAIFGGRKSLIAATVLLGFTLLENSVLMIAFYGLRNRIAGDILLEPSIGIYAFILFCAIAFVILVLLWITGGFRESERKKRESLQKDKRKERQITSRKRNVKRRGRKRRRKGKKCQSVFNRKKKRSKPSTKSEKNPANGSVEDKKEVQTNQQTEFNLDMEQELSTIEFPEDELIYYDETDHSSPRKKTILEEENGLLDCTTIEINKITSEVLKNM